MTDRRTLPFFVFASLCLFLLLGCSRAAPRGPCSGAGPVPTICGFENPEDIEWVPDAGLLVVSDLRMWNVKIPGGGFLSALEPGSTEIRKLWPTGEADDLAPEPAFGDPSCPGPPDPKAFFNHGLTSVPRGDGAILYVVGHRSDRGEGREAVEVFYLRGRGKDARVAWKACIPTEGAIQVNDVAVAPDGAVIVSNYQPTGSPWHTIRSVMLGRKTGDVMGWKALRGWRHVPDTAARQANGVAVSPSGEWIYYSETGSGLVHRITSDGSPPHTTVKVGGNPDNLSWTSRGTLLVATHTGGARFLGCANGRLPCRTSWEIHEIDPATMSEKRILVHDGSSLGAVSAATEAGGKIYLGSVFDDRIGAVPTAP
jgi:hypothetical protein